MFGGALSYFFELTIRVKNVGNIKGSTLTLVLVVLALIGSVVGFKKLIGILLPICGYVRCLSSFLSMQKKTSIDVNEPETNYNNIKTY